MIQTIKNNSRKLTLLVLGLALVATGASSFAILTDTLSVTTQLSVMTIDLDGNGTDAVNFQVSFTDAPTEVKTLDLQNAGNGELRYAATSSATGTLTSKVDLKITLPDGGGCPAVATGQVISTGPAGLVGQTIGSAAQGQQAGDRTLAASATERVCLYFTPNTTLSSTDTAISTVTFSAEQTAGN